MDNNEDDDGKQPMCHARSHVSHIINGADSVDACEQHRHTLHELQYHTPLVDDDDDDGGTATDATFDSCGMTHGVCGR